MATAIIIYIILSGAFHIVAILDFYTYNNEILDDISELLGFTTMKIIVILLMPYLPIWAFLDWNFNSSETNKEIEWMQKENDKNLNKSK